MGKQGIKRRVYTPEFKTEAVALVEKREKSVGRIALVQAAGDGSLRLFPGHGRPRDQELVRLRKENKALREANEILKKRRSSSHRETPSDGVSVHAGKPRTVYRHEDGRLIWGQLRGVL